MESNNAQIILYDQFRGKLRYAFLVSRDKKEKVGEKGVFFENKFLTQVPIVSASELELFALGEDLKYFTLNQPYKRRFLH